jgi:dipeptidyl aminopeptidase/acylaminoacyl peptidase
MVESLTGGNAMRRPLHAVLACAILALAAVTVRAEVREVSLPEGHDFTNPERQPFALSPDGTRIAYLAHATLFVKPVGDGPPMVVPGPLAGRGVANPVFSPDGQTILYWAQDGSVLQRVPAGGGTPTTICKVDLPYGMSWGADDEILVGEGAQGILRVSAQGGTPETVIRLESGELAYGPQMLPGGNTVLFTLRAPGVDSWDQADVVVQSLISGDRRTIVSAARDARYLPGGQLVYVSGGRLLAVAFDAKVLRTSGQPVELVQNVWTAKDTGAAQYSVTAGGTLAYVAAGTVPMQLGVVGLNGGRRMLGPVPEGTSAPRVSPDGLRVTFAAAGDIYVADLANLAGARKVISPGNFPLFSPDGQWIAFGSLGTRRDGGQEELFLQRADGSGEPELIVKPARAPEYWPAGDQGFSFITHRGTANNYDLWIYSVKDREVAPLVVLDESAQLSSAFSPDRHWFAYMSSESGDWQIYVQPYPTTGAKYQVTSGGGRLPMWSGDGGKIYYEHDGQMFEVSVGAGPQPTFGTPVGLPITGFVQPLIRRNYDMMPDHQSFLMLFRPGPEIVLLTDWLNRLPSAGAN